jgi:hypothetical protein
MLEIQHCKVWKERNAMYLEGPEATMIAAVDESTSKTNGNSWIMKKRTKPNGNYRFRWKVWLLNWNFNSF